MLRHARRAVAAVLLTLLVIASATGPVAANFPGRNGQIVFQRFDADGNWQIWVANPDLSSPTSDHDSAHPTTASRPGRRMDLGSRSRATARTPTRPTTSISRTSSRCAPTGAMSARSPTRPATPRSLGWSPDGRWLLFASSGADYPRSMGIYIVRSNGSGAPRRLTRLSGTSFWQELARFSPDGKAIEYTEYRPARKSRRARGERADHRPLGRLAPAADHPVGTPRGRC